MLMMLAVVIEGPPQSFGQANFWRPVEGGAKAAEIAVVVANINGGAIGRKRNQLAGAAAIQLHQHIGQLFQANDFAMAEVEDLPIGLRSRRQKQGLDRVVDKIKIAALPAVA